MAYHLQAHDAILKCDPCQTVSLPNWHDCDRVVGTGSAVPVSVVLNRLIVVFIVIHTFIF